jgi:hypothetical protein
VAATTTLEPEIQEVLYHWNPEHTDTQRIGTLAQVRVADTPQPHEFDSLVDEVYNFLRSYLSKPRPDLSVGLDTLQKRTDYSTVLYQVEERGVKASGLVNLGVLLPNSALDQSKVYALLPLIPGYDCDLVRLAYSNAQWVLRDEKENKQVTSTTCRAKSLDHWVVEVQVSGGNTELQNRLTQSLYDAIDRNSTRYQQLWSFQRESQRIEEQNRNIPPMAQVALSRAQANFTLRLSVK